MPVQIRPRAEQAERQARSVKVTQRSLKPQRSARGNSGSNPDAPAKQLKRKCLSWEKISICCITRSLSSMLRLIRIPSLFSCLTLTRLNFSHMVRHRTSSRRTLWENSSSAISSLAEETSVRCLQTHLIRALLETICSRNL